MLRRALLLLLLSQASYAQVVIEGSESAVDTTSPNTGPITESSFVMPANTDALLVFFGSSGAAGTVTATWDTSESLTEAGTTTFSGGSDNTGVKAFCLLAPTVTTADVVVDWQFGVAAVWITVHALSGVEQTSCAAAMTELDEDVDNDAASNDAVFAELGAAGDEGFIATSMVSDNATASNDATWTELFESSTGGGVNLGPEDFSFNVIHGALPEAVTVTISETDEHAALYMSVAAEVASAAIQRRRRQ